MIIVIGVVYIYTHGFSQIKLMVNNDQLQLVGWNMMVTSTWMRRNVAAVATFCLGRESGVGSEQPCESC